MTLTQPVWLVLAIPLAAAMLYWPLPGRLMQVLRALAVGLMVLAMAGLAIDLPSRAGTVVIVADRSFSMPADSEQVQTEAVKLIQEQGQRTSHLAVVAFGRKATVELAPQGGRFSGFVTRTDPEGSDLAAAVDLAASLVPPESPGRVLVLSDGRHTGGEPLAAASRAAAREIAVDYRLVQRPATSDLAISRVDAPSSVGPAESFLISVWVRSPISQEIAYELRRGQTVLAGGARAVAAGDSRLTFRDRAADSGVGQYTVRISAGGDDPVPENNRARILVGVRGDKPLLCVSPRGPSGLSRLLAAGGVNVAARTPQQCRWSLADLSQYSGVLIENTPADDITAAGMETISAWVREIGSGLMMTGGRNAYGPGGYFRSPLEDVLPVSMELRREHRKLALAIVVALDRSGSMAVPVSAGRTKMDLADLGAAEVVQLLSSMDEFGCLAVDSSPHVIVNLAPVSDKKRITDKILRIRSEGGGIFVYEALSKAAEMLAKAQAGTRHIILFADAADAEQPGKYKELLEQCRRANITVSVIGLGTRADSDARLLEEIAKRGRGRCFFTESAQQLPRLFAQDTFVVARSAFLDEQTPITTTGSLMTLAQRRFSDAPPIGGYNLCYLRPEAIMAARTVDEYEAPVVAAWNVGAGRALSYTGEADGEYTGPIARWGDVGEFFSSLARWTMGQAAVLPDEMLLTQEVVDGACRIQLHLDPERTDVAFGGMPKVTMLKGELGGRLTSRRDQMRWASTDVLELTVPLDGGETALAAVEIPSIGRFSLAPVCLPYSPEYRPADQQRGAEVLEQVARITGGRQRVNLSGIWQDLPARARQINLAPWLLMAAIVVLLLEIFQRRTGLLSVWRPIKARAVAAEQAAPQPPAPGRRRRGRRRRRAAKSAEAPEAVPPAPEAPAAAKAAEPPPPTEDLGDLLRRARRRAKGRTDRREF